MRVIKPSVKSGSREFAAAWCITFGLVSSYAHSNEADDYLARKAQTEALVNARYLTVIHDLGAPCDRVVGHFGWDSTSGQQAIFTVLCETGGKRTLYEVARGYVGPDGKHRFRVATPQQVADDLTTLSQGLFLAGSWWKGEPAKGAQ
jgi:hypothetical protein